MYPEAFVERVNTQNKAMIRNAVIILLVSLIAAILMGVFVSSPVGLVLLCLGIAAYITYWGVRGSQVWAYHRFAMEMCLGRHREIETEILRVSEGPVYKDNKLYFYEIETIQGGVERMLLWDANFPLPAIQPGQKVTFSVIDKYIWDIVHSGG